MKNVKKQTVKNRIEGAIENNVQKNELESGYEADEDTNIENEERYDTEETEWKK